MLHKKNVWLNLFFLAALVNLYAEIIPNQVLTYISKPLLMIFLGLHFWANRNKNRYTNLILAGLFFAFLGDTFLLLKTQSGQGALFFLLGLGSFLITQLLYMQAFFGYAKGKGYVRQNVWLALPFLAFLIGNTYTLWEGLPAAFRVPVLMYSTIIALMAVSCLNLYQVVPGTIFKILFVGVLLFMLSDSLIGFSQFRKDLFTIPYAGFLIMSTYIIAQYLIIKGSLFLHRS